MRTWPRPTGRGLRARSAVLAVCLTMLSACTVGPSRRPALATSGHGPAAPAATTSTTSSTPTPTGPGGPGRRSAPIVWGPCPPADREPGATDSWTVTCSDIPVPVSYDDPEGPTITIRVARAVGSAADPDPAPLIALPEASGRQPTADVAAIAAALPATITDRYAIVTLDRRGTGSSSGIDCVSDRIQHRILGLRPASESGSSAAGDATTTLSDAARTLAFNCGDVGGDALTQYDSTNAADDLDTLRAALGIARVNLVASGDGARIGAVYADRYPGRVGRIVLDSPGDPTAPPVQRAVAAATALHDLVTDFAAACPHFDGGCPLGDDPAETIEAMAHSTSVATAGDWIVTGDSVIRALITLLPQRASWPALATAVADLGKGSAKRLLTMVRHALGDDTISEHLSAQLIYRCNDTATRLTGDTLADARRQAEARAPVFGAALLADQAWCADWPAPEHALGRLTAHGAAPMLVVGSVKNPRHPYRGVQSLAAQLEPAVLVSWQSGEDVSYPTNACVTDAVDRYLLRGDTPGRGLLCPP